MARLYAAWEICSIAADSYPLSGVLPVEKQSSKERWEAAAVLFICGADHAGLHLPGDSGDPDEIPDRVLFLCMDLGSSAPDSTDRLGMYRVPVYPVERKKYPECGSHVAPGGNCDPEWVSDRTGTQMTQVEQPREVLRQLSEYHLEESGETEYSLWAPKEILAAARAYSADIHPVYGRSIWDAALGSYSYDTYEIWQEDLYLWMNHLEETGEPEYVRTEENTGERTIDFRTCLDSAAAAGVDYILLPGDLPEDTVEKLQETLGTDTELKTTAGYYLIEIG